jgi:cyclopropane fatty-acyl-phospholipid synthase-like methyltransferase
MAAIVTLEYKNTLVLIDIAAGLGSTMLRVATEGAAKIVQSITLSLEEAEFQRQHAEIFVVNV